MFKKNDNNLDYHFEMSGERQNKHFKFISLLLLAEYTLAHIVFGAMALYLRCFVMELWAEPEVKRSKFTYKWDIL